MKRLLYSLILALMAMSFIVPEKAFALDIPSPYTIVAATGYKDLAETGDMLILAELQIGDSSYNPTDFTVSQSWVVRWMNIATEFVAVAPFSNPYYHNGYGSSVVGLYLSAADVTSLGAVYGSSNYTVSLERNPAIVTWNGTPPSPTSLSVSWTDVTKDMRNALRIRILQLASDFRSDWGLTFNLTESGSLTSYGENYFTGAITNLRLLCPQVFSSFITSPTFRKKTFNLTYALTLRNQWLGTQLDLTQPAADWGVDAIWLYGGLWTIVLFAACWGTAAISNSNKGLYWVVLMGIGIGGFLGFLPWSALGLSAFITILIIINELLYKRSPS